ncbi:MAG: GH25 family lysozyme [Clostridia bacterium]|nr:GH25 family lysozyme [Clostridia bacterium]
MKNLFKGKLNKIPKPVLICCGAVIAAALIGFGGYEGFRLFMPTTIYGIDASHYQGDISWRAVAESGNVKFVYLKATEGKSYQDPNFSEYWSGASKFGLTEGAYHYYSQSSTGAEQASNFIATVPKAKGKLPPAIDIETSITTQSDFKTQLADYVRLVTAHYGQKPVFYVPPKVYNMLYDDYKGYSFWVIDISGSPTVNGWAFWQYSEKGTVGGVDSKVDLDRYRGSLWSFRSLLSK